MDANPTLIGLAKALLRHLARYSRLVVNRPLYDYQLAPALAIIDSVLHRRGLEFAVLFPRQSGKNETQAHMEAYLLNLFQRTPGAAIVKAQPTYRPQALNAQDRLERTLHNPWDLGRWQRRAGHQIRLAHAGVNFLSAAPQASVAGATASLLLECDEAQDVSEAEWDKKFLPMAASTNATVVYWGTAWTSRSLLAKTIRRLREQERADGQARVFIVSPEEVRQVNPAYGAHVDREVAKKGRQHPLIRTQYFNEELDAETGMFPPARRALMRGRHRRRDAPEPDTAAEQHVYALLLDVAGAEENQMPGAGHLDNPRRDATALTIVEVDLATVADVVMAAPTYRAVYRRVWRGAKHPALYGEVRALALQWQARYLVADATGVGAGLAGFLEKALPRVTVIAFTFNSATKSQLGWDFLALCDAGRWQDYELGAGDPDGLTFWSEVAHCQYEVLPGLTHPLRWGVPDGTLDEFNEPVHDDLLISAALVAVLDRQPWHVDTGPTVIIRGRDPLEEMSRGY